MLLAKLALELRGQVRFDQRVWVETTVTEVGESSVELAQEVYADGEVAATLASTVVFFDPQAQQPKPVPSEARVKLGAGRPL